MKFLHGFVFLAAFCMEHAIGAISEMKFRVGFEFQVMGDFCREVDAGNWKNAIFVMSLPDGKKLWHVEIDEGDIEFVTADFSYLEKEHLAICLKSIQNASRILQDLFKRNDRINFHQWIEAILFNAGNSKLQLLVPRSKCTSFDIIKPNSFKAHHPTGLDYVGKACKMQLKLSNQSHKSCVFHQVVSFKFQTKFSPISKNVFLKLTSEY
jgi:hypothetical protein